MRRSVFFMVCLVVPVLCQAAVVVNIVDLLDVGSPLVSTSGFDPTSLSIQLNPESVDIHGEYLSTLNLGNGVTVSVNFDFIEPAGEPGAIVGSISDTLNIVFTGHTPTPADANNLSVDLHFRSDSDPTGLPALVNAINVTETGSVQSLAGSIFSATGVADFQANVTSDVPEPGTSVLMLAGLGGLLLGVRRLHQRQRMV
jgi:hypothetical protein